MLLLFFCMAKKASRAVRIANGRRRTRRREVIEEVARRQRTQGDGVNARHSGRRGRRRFFATASTEPIRSAEPKRTGRWSHGLISTIIIVDVNTAGGGAGVWGNNVDHEEARWLLWKEDEGARGGVVYSREMARFYHTGSIV